MRLSDDGVYGALACEQRVRINVCPFILCLGRCVDRIPTQDRISNASTNCHVPPLRCHLARNLLKPRLAISLTVVRVQHSLMVMTR